jgi:hypothetical protein
MESGMHGISSLDPRIAATEKFIQEKKIPPDQVENFLLSMGADPRLASLVFKYRKVTEAAKNAQQGPPPTASVNQKISDQYRQMQQGLAAMPAPAIANAPMQGGITGQPMPQMAGGGIIAFAKGSPGVFLRNPIKTAAGTAAGVAAAGYGVRKLLKSDGQPLDGATVEEESEGPTDEDIKLLAGMDEAKQPAAADMGLLQPPAFKRPDFTQYNAAISDAEKRMPKDRQAAYTEEMDREKDLGETAAIAARAKTLEGQKAKATTSPEEKFWKAVAQGGFAASAKGARNLWETLSVGGVEGMKAYEGMKQQEASTLEKIADKQLQLNSMTAAVKRGAMDRGDKRFDAARTELQNLRLQQESQKIAITNAENTAAAANWREIYSEGGANQRAITMAGKSANRQKLEEQYFADIAAANKTTDPKLKAAYKRRAESILAAKAKLERTESGYQGTVLRNQLPDVTGGDGFGGMRLE